MGPLIRAFLDAAQRLLPSIWEFAQLRVLGPTVPFGMVPAANPPIWELEGAASFLYCGFLPFSGAGFTYAVSILSESAVYRFSDSSESA